MNNENTVDSSSRTAQYNLKKFKLVFLGDMGVGKTSIIKRFIFDDFEENNSATVGVDLVSKAVTIDGKTVRLNLWDTAGQERFRCLIPGYIRDSNVAVIVYDITKRASFDSLKNWVEEVKSKREDDIIYGLVGCKIDLESERDVSTDEGRAFAESIKAVFGEVSAKNGKNITEFFQNVINTLTGESVSTTNNILARNLEPDNKTPASGGEIKLRADDQKEGGTVTKKKSSCC